MGNNYLLICLFSLYIAKSIIKSTGKYSKYFSTICLICWIPYLYLLLIILTQFSSSAYLYLFLFLWLLSLRLVRTALKCELSCFAKFNILLYSLKPWLVKSTLAVILSIHLYLCLSMIINDLFLYNYFYIFL